MIFNLVGSGSGSGGGGDTPSPPAPPITKTITYPQSGYWNSVTAGSSALLRMKLTQEYSSSDNSSNITLKFQFKNPSTGSWATLTGKKSIIGGSIAVDNVAIYTFPVGGGAQNDYVTYDSNNSWVTAKSGASDGNLEITFSKVHSSSGSVKFKMRVYINVATGVNDMYLGFDETFNVTLSSTLDSSNAFEEDTEDEVI